MSLLGLVCRITEISNPGLRKEGGTHKHRRAGARVVSRCTARSQSCFHFDALWRRERFSSAVKVNKKLLQIVFKIAIRIGSFWDIGV